MPKNKTKFTVKKNMYKDGRLHVIETLFELLEDAVEFLLRSPHHSAKVLDHKGRVVYNHGKHNCDTYA